MNISNRANRPIFPNLEDIEAIIFDFDGVFTDNKVYVDSLGNETVRCDRGDGLGLDILRSYIEKKNLRLETFILSKEKNSVVSRRAEKLKIGCFQGIDSKASFLCNYAAEKKINPKKILYLGNDLNDLGAIKFAGFVVSPSDSHPLVINEADVILSSKGGEGFVREFVEEILNIRKMLPDEVINLLEQ